MNWRRTDHTDDKDLQARLPGARSSHRRRAVDLYVVHFKSMGSPRDGLDGRDATMPVRARRGAGCAPHHRGSFRRGSCGRQELRHLRRHERLPGARRRDRHAPHRLSFRASDEEPRARSMSSARRRLCRKRRAAPRRSWTAGRSITRAGRRSSGFASSTISGCRRRLPQRQCDAHAGQSSAAASLIAPYFRRDRRSSVIRAPAGTGRRPPTIAPSS